MRDAEALPQSPCLFQPDWSLVEAHIIPSQGVGRGKCDCPSPYIAQDEWGDLPMVEMVAQSAGARKRYPCLFGLCGAFFSFTKSNYAAQGGNPTRGNSAGHILSASERKVS
jgi:hypothetical protein